VDDAALASSWAVMRAHGNLSGASNLAVLDHHNHGCTAEEKDGKWVVCISMGPGVCIEGALLRRISAVDADGVEESTDANEMAFTACRSLASDGASPTSPYSPVGHEFTSQSVSKAKRFSYENTVKTLQSMRSTFSEHASKWDAVAGEYGSA